MRRIDEERRDHHRNIAELRQENIDEREQLLAHFALSARGRREGQLSRFRSEQMFDEEPSDPDALQELVVAMTGAGRHQDRRPLEGLTTGRKRARQLAELGCVTRQRPRLDGAERRLGGTK